MNFFLDTSALLKLYHDEEGTENLWNLLIENSSDLFLTISDLTPIEFHSALLKRVRMEEIGLDTAIKIFTNFSKDLELMNIIEIDRSIKNFAVDLLKEHASTKTLKTLDALQLSSAIISNNNFTIDYFIASDRRFLDLARLFFKTHNPVK